MFEISMKTESDTFKQAMYDAVLEVMIQINEDKKLGNDLPVLLSKSQLAKHIFNVSPQTLDAHIIQREDFPKFKVGERLLFPRDMVMEWLRKNINAD
ncbi:helix-turn-helix domain-containing protein (plasmid) [Cytobacillus spongiae]|uniref:helix-turn-helix domain-containing protein n=1 Tax=Cytobacillus spongiae TaxID=2901381 RepID=UPI001F2FBB3D|nr:helix-turn-helix domain-containing protein [Cytobacillus spongiae]UII58092.1 helix-turn-helix domain-containing protein [Cytobacillus spongiae]